MNQTPTEIRRSIRAACDGLAIEVIVERLAEAHVTIDALSRQLQKEAAKNA